MNETKTLRALVTENPMLLLFLGVCPALGATTDVRAALGMGGAVLLVMLLSGLVLNLCGKWIAAKARIPAAVLVVAGFASVVQLLMNALLPNVFQMLGLYLTVVAVDILILADSGEACEKNLTQALLQSLIVGASFAVLLLLTALLREALGAGSFAGFEIPGLASYHVPVLVQPAGGFIVLSILAAVLNSSPVVQNSFRGFAMKAAGLPVPEEEPAETGGEEAAE